MGLLRLKACTSCRETLRGVDIQDFAQVQGLLRRACERGQ
jgi:hypothetical protein